jgi:hypothetical protein
VVYHHPGDRACPLMRNYLAKDTCNHDRADLANQQSDVVKATLVLAHRWPRHRPPSASSNLALGRTRFKRLAQRF